MYSSAKIWQEPDRRATLGRVPQCTRTTYHPTAQPFDEEKYCRTLPSSVVKMKMTAHDSVTSRFRAVGKRGDMLG
jgi:hypothetical protein